MVFKVFTSTLVDNGKGSTSGDSSRTGGEEVLGNYYELYGSGWHRYDTAGHDGTVDAIPVNTADASAYYKVNIGLKGEHDVLVHFPTSRYATTEAKYEVFIVDYLEQAAGESSLGAPVLTATVDQTAETSYSTAANDEGFISIGTISVNLVEPEVVTVVIKLSPADRGESRSGDATLLLSDAVMLEKVE
jgi:hypothetical protein